MKTIFIRFMDNDLFPRCQVFCHTRKPRFWRCSGAPVWCRWGCLTRRVCSWPSTGTHFHRAPSSPRTSTPSTVIRAGGPSRKCLIRPGFSMEMAGWLDPRHFSHFQSVRSRYYALRKSLAVFLLLKQLNYKDMHYTNYDLRLYREARLLRRIFG